MAETAFVVAEQIAALRQELVAMRQELAEMRRGDEARITSIEAAIAETEEQIAALAKAMTRAVADTLRQQRVGTGAKPAGDPKGAFADPGYQKDGKPRYPLDTPEHIRAAWAYVHEHRDEAEYSPRQLEEIERRIIAAWKAKIDPAGPPESEDDGDNDPGLDDRETKPADPDRDTKPPQERREQAVTRGRKGREKPKPDGVLGWLVW